MPFLKWINGEIAVIMSRVSEPFPPTVLVYPSAFEYIPKITHGAARLFLFDSFLLSPNISGVHALTTSLRNAQFLFALEHYARAL